MNLLVTGGAGFIGSHFIRRALRETSVQQVVNLDCLSYAANLHNTSDFQSQPRYRLEPINLLEKKKVHQLLQKERFSHVVHLAAETHVDRSIADPQLFVDTNVLGTLHLLEGLRSTWNSLSESNRLLHVSTDEVYGSCAEGTFNESSPYAPSSPYSASKAGADMLVRAYHATYRFPAVLSHCSNNFGPGQFPEKLIPVVITAILGGRPIPLYGDGLHVREWLYVEDTAEALWTILNRGKVGESYHIGGGKELANLQTVEMICDLVDEALNRPLGTARKQIRHVTDRPGHDRRYSLNPGKLERELGWVPKTAFESGLRKTVLWYLQNRDHYASLKQPLH